MELFKKLVGDIAKTVGESLEEVSNEAKKSFQEAREEVRKNIQEAKQNQFNSDDDDDDDNWDYPLTTLSDDDDDIRIQLGHFKKWRFNHRRGTYNSRRRCLGGVQ